MLRLVRQAVTELTEVHQAAVPEPAEGHSPLIPNLVIVHSKRIQPVYFPSIKQERLRFLEVFLAASTGLEPVTT